MRAVACIFTTLALSGCASSKGESRTPASEVPSAKPPSPHNDDVGIAGEGFFIDVPVWLRTSDSHQIGLSAKYKWGSSEERTSEGTSGGTYWRLTFPDRPKPADVAKITLTYKFDLTAADRAEIDKAVAAVIKATFDALEPGEGSLDDRIKAGSPSISSAAKPLAKFHTPDGVAGDELMLKQLGFKRRADGSFELADTKPLAELGNEDVRLAETEFADAVKATKAALAKATKPAAPTACSTAIEGLPKDGKAARAARLSCAEAVRELTAANLAATTGRSAAEVAAAKKSDDAAAAVVAALKKDDAATPLSDQALSGQMGHLNQEAKINATYPWLAFRHALATVGSIEAQSRSAMTRAKLAEKLTSRIEVLERDEIGSVLLQSAGELRRYDVSTGVVWVGGLQDIVTPILIATCPFGGGCLRKGESVATEPWRTISFDLGVKARTLDAVDARQRDALSFLIGASFNPIYFIRISGGLYTFENQQTENWNATGYVGATVNMLQAAELFGVIGFGTPSAPKIAGQ